ncbi:uracil-DNA glycosylase [Roseiconus lacunae]|uniref:Type-4 uracil-DNA glycosylase n=1 Tax=Roseiconus lacunae TaxID=2605694 RepID=A0ABT7PCX8_9BACT|nr:uracil-DNA glycosylase [Roseiconus lacunae]MDM4014355.1 uracil-DNA glycosylase [Roseiconus lacunae]
MNHSSSKLDPADVLAQAGGLADHLKRLGVQWLPQANADQVTALAEFFAFDDAIKTESNSFVQPAASESSANTPGASQRPAKPAKSTAAKSAASPAGGFQLSNDLGSGGGSYPGMPLSEQERVARLAADAEQVSSCLKCDVLAKCRTKTVYGEGSVTPRVVFFGEGPGRDEDISGRPFVGKAGQLLTKMIQACKFEREEVYIMNTVKCRPPNNRNPEATEIDNCREFFEAQLEVLRPEYIVCLGVVSAQALLRNKLSVGRMRGRFHSYFDSKVVVTYHPAYLLREPAAKKAAWTDLQMMLRDAGLL